MPIRPENRGRYPKDWKAISLGVRNRAGWRCEGDACVARQGARHPVTGSTVVLTVAHLDHQPENCDPANLKALCQRCHNAYDAPTRAAGLKARRRARMAARDLFEDGR